MVYRLNLSAFDTLILLDFVICKDNLKMMICPPYLKKGDKVAITCPAKKLPHGIDDAVGLLESWGLELILGDTVTAAHHQFAGTDELRAKDLQRFLDDRDIKAIFAARGGYGTVRIIDQLDFSSLKRSPKWIVGFSDITVLHAHLQAELNMCSIHGQMPLTIPDGSKPSLESLRMALFGEAISYQFNSAEMGKDGEAIGKLIGGNLSLMVNLNGSVSDPDYRDKILFLEDVGEHLYAIDRLFWNLKRSGKLAQIKGLIIGGFTELKDFDPPFGQDVREIVLDMVKEYDYPVCFDFPAGHVSDNRALILGKTVNLKVKQTEVNLHYID
jgi:muramoyltetrapeptide carboxypeptidase